MKLSVVLGSALALTMAVGVGAGVAINSQSKQVQAATVERASTRIYLQDEHGEGWTYGEVHPHIHLYDVHFTSGSGYSENDLSQVTSNGFVGASNSFDFSTTENEIIFRMRWDNGDKGRAFAAIIPWYVASFKAYFVGQNGTKTLKYYYNDSGWKIGNRVEVSAVAGNEIKIYAFGNKSWDDTSAFASEISIPTPYSTSFTQSVEQYSVTVAAGSNGSVSPSGTATYNEGQRLNLVATPDSGYSFTKWSDNDTNASRSFVVKSDTAGTYTASFAQLDPLDAPVISLNENTKIVSWGEVSGAVSYEVSVNGASENVGLNRTYARKLEAGTYNIKVKAIANNTSAVSSAWSNQVSYTVTGFYLLGTGDLGWDVDADALVLPEISSGVYGVSSVTLEDGQEFKAVHHTTNGTDWISPYDENLSHVDYNVEAWADEGYTISVTDNDHNLKVAKGGNYRISYNTSNYRYEVYYLGYAPTYTVTIGDSQPATLIAASAGDYLAQYSGTVSSVDSGDSIIFKAGSQTIVASPDNQTNNNVNLDNNNTILEDSTSVAVWLKLKTDHTWEYWIGGRTHDHFLWYGDDLIPFVSNPDTQSDKPWCIQGLTITANTCVSRVYSGVDSWYSANIDSATQNYAIVDGHIELTVTDTYDIYIDVEEPGYQFYYGSQTTMFADSFFHDMSQVCKTDNTTDPVALKAAWDNFVTGWASLDAATSQNYLTNASSTSSASLAQFASSYDYIYGKYSSVLKVDFAGRSPSPIQGDRIAPVTSASTDSTTPIIMVVVIASMSLTVIGGYLLIKRKKAN